MKVEELAENGETMSNKMEREMKQKRYTREERIGESMGNSGGKLN